MNIRFAVAEKTSIAVKRKSPDNARLKGEEYFLRRDFGMNTARRLTIALYLAAEAGQAMPLFTDFPSFPPVRYTSLRPAGDPAHTPALRISDRSH
jgi:hypothetical protein